MRVPVPWRASAASPRLYRRERGERSELWTETVGSPPPVYGERWTTVGGRTYRSFEPARSKLAAGLARGWDGPLPSAGERWLYLGAASGTTASHVADLLGSGGRLYAVERSLRPFARLLAVAERWPNLLPLLADARGPERYADVVPIIDGLYADIAQPDQVEIVLANARYFLRDGRGGLVVALKTSSMGRDAAAPAHLRRAEATLSAEFDLVPAVRLDPFYRSHYLIGGQLRGGRAGPPEARRPLRPGRGPRDRSRRRR
jgi:fibrillarin-like pre-rRNA processing protein